MLSQNDIVKELGRGINIHPFKEENLKENSYNLTASEHAWATKNSRQYKIKKGKSCVRVVDGNKQIILLPLSTTLIVTEEVIGVGSIGGTYHSKVGLVSTGLGHIGTMLGPNFCGHSLIAIHNISEEIKMIKVGETFASVVFHKLDTPSFAINATYNGHIDKYIKLGITENFDSITEDWKSRISDISDRMKQSQTYKEFKDKVWRYRRNEMRAYINVRNVFIAVLVLSLMLSPIIIENLAAFGMIEIQTKEDYTKFFYNVGLSGIFVLVFQVLYSSIKPKR